MLKMDGDTHFLSIFKNDLHFVLTTDDWQVSASMTMEFLARIAQVIQDYCGRCSEDAIRTHFVLVYELADEMLDGVPQITATEKLKSFVHPPKISQDAIQMLMSALPSKVTASTASSKPISMDTSELFIDHIENLTAFFSQGHLHRADIEGEIRIRSFLDGKPSLFMTVANLHMISDDSSIHKNGVMDAKADAIAVHQLPQGEFTLLSYKLDAYNFHMPFRVFPSVSLGIANLVDIQLTLISDLPPTAEAKVTVKLPLPPCAATFTTTHKAEMKEGVVIWTIKKLRGGTEAVLGIKTTLDKKKDVIGPISIAYETAKVISPVGIRFIKLNDSAKISKWVREVGKSQSYTVTLT